MNFNYSLHQADKGVIVLSFLFLCVCEDSIDLKCM